MAHGTVLDAAIPERIDSFVAAVGVQRYGTAETTPVAMWDEVLDVNVRARFPAVKHTVPLMRRNGGGAIVNVASAQATASQRNTVIAQWGANHLLGRVGTPVAVAAPGKPGKPGN